MIGPTNLTRASVMLAGLMCLSASLREAQAQVPRPPLTERYSVQMFLGGTQNCWIAVWPPSDYADGTPIPFGTEVQIKVYRSYDAGKTYAERDVEIVGGPAADGKGKVGQGERDPREKEWIDCKLKTPVDYNDPFAVWLAVTAIVNGKESEKNNLNLNFRYRESSTGQPALIRYATPEEAQTGGSGLADELARPLPQELPGKWAEGAQFIIRSVYVTPGMQAKINGGEVEGCNAAILKALEEKKGVPLPMEMNVKTIDLVQAPGLPGGVPIDPGPVKDPQRKNIFAGTLTLSFQDPANPQPPKDEKPISFAYLYFERLIRFDQTDKGTRSSFGGSFFQNATHYLVFGNWRVLITDDKAPGESADIKGTWTVSKRKPK